MSFKRVTGKSFKLRDDWKIQRDNMAYRIAYLMKIRDIPIELIVNSDQTGIHLVPNAGDILFLFSLYEMLMTQLCTLSYVAGQHTWNTTGSDGVEVISSDDKRQLTALLSVTAAGSMLPMQLVYQGKTIRSQPKGEVRKLLQLAGHVFTLNEKNHWSNEQTMREFVTEVLKPYFCSVQTSYN